MGYVQERVSVLTVRQQTALKIKGMAKANGKTVDGVLEQLLKRLKGANPPPPINHGAF